MILVVIYSKSDGDNEHDNHFNYDEKDESDVNAYCEHEMMAEFCCRCYCCCQLWFFFFFFIIRQ